MLERVEISFWVLKSTHGFWIVLNHYFCLTLNKNLASFRTIFNWIVSFRTVMLLIKFYVFGLVYDNFGYLTTNF